MKMKAIDFKVSVEDNQKLHLAEGYSTGYCDLIDLCMRLALVDTLFEEESPFLILDDPFVNLDEDRLDKSMDLLQLIASDILDDKRQHRGCNTILLYTQ